MIQHALSALLERLQAPVLPPTLKAATLRYRFTLDGKERCDLLLDRGRLSLEDAKGQPDCLVECTSEEFNAILSSQHNMLTAFMRGDVRFQGKLSSAKALYTFLRYAHLGEAKG